MRIFADIPFELDLAAILEQLHLGPDSEDVPELKRLIGQCKAAGKPRAVYKESFIDARGADTVTIDGIMFRSRALRMNLDKVERVFPFIVTCGPEFDRIPVPPDDFFKRFWLDTIKAAALGCAIKRLDEHLAREFPHGKSTSMSPGSGDVDVWPIEQQKELFSLFGDVKKHIGVDLTDTFLMIPNKTVSGIRFPAEVDFHTCQLCHRKNCPSRHAPFDEAMWKATRTSVPSV